MVRPSPWRDVNCLATHDRCAGVGNAGSEAVIGAVDTATIAATRRIVLSRQIVELPASCVRVFERPCPGVSILNLVMRTGVT
jgi:hypothetical protein